MKERFANLPAEKQSLIINAAFQAFGKNGYRKASINDIASASGVSKPSMFHYFGTKEALYFYLVEYCVKVFADAYEQELDKSEDDFFEKIRSATNVKLSVIKENPHIITFIESAFNETDPEVTEKLSGFLPKEFEFSTQLATQGANFSKFKDGVNGNTVMNMLWLLTDGYISRLSGKTGVDYERLFLEFDEYLELLKTHLYKEEYL